MNWQFSIFAIPLFFSSIIAAILAYHVYQRQTFVNARAFILLMVGITTWSAAYAIELSSISISAKIFWVKISYFGAASIPTLWFIFTVQYSQKEKWLTRLTLLLLALQPFLTMLLTWTNDFHHFMWRAVELLDNQFLVFSYGIGFWITVVYSYLLILIGTYLLLRPLSNLANLHGSQTSALLVGVSSPWIGNILYVSKWNPLAPLDPTPFAFLISGIAFYVGFYRYHLLTTLPIVQSSLLENLSEGIIVLDRQNRIVSLNPSAKKVVGENSIGTLINSALPDASMFMEQHEFDNQAQETLWVGIGQAQRCFDWRLTAIYDASGRINGRLITLHDITERIQAEDTLRQRERHLTLLNDITQAAASALDSQTMLQTLANRLGELVDADACHIALWDEKEHRAIPAAASGPFHDSYASVEVYPGEMTITESVLAAGHALMIDKTDNPHYVSPRLSAQFPNSKSILALPLIAVGQKLGAALLLFTDIRTFSAHEISQIEQASQQIALAIAKTKFYDAANRQVEELAILNEIAIVGAEATNVDELIEWVTQIIGNELYSDNFGIMLLDENTQALCPHWSYKHLTDSTPPYDPFSLDTGIVGLVARTGKAKRIADIAQEPEYLPIVPDTRSELCVPLKVDDRIIGVINTECVRLNAYSQEDERLLTTLAGQLATAVAKIRLLEAEQSRRQTAETLREATASLTATLDLNHLLDMILVQLEKVIAYDSATVFLFEGTAARIVAARGLPDNDDATNQLFTTENALTNQIGQKMGPIYLKDAQETPGFQSWRRTNDVRGWIGVPLIVRNTIIGQLTIDSLETGRYDEADADLALAFANQAAATIENVRLYQEAQRNAAEQRITSNILRILSATPDVISVFPTIAEILAQATNCIRSSLFLLDESGDWGKMVALDQPSETLGQGTRIDVAQTSATNDCLAGNMHITPDLAAETHFLAEKMLYDAGVRSRINIPLQLSDRVIGSLNLVWPKINGFDPGQFPMLNQIAEGIALAVERSRLFDETQRRAAELEAISNVSAALRVAQTVDAILPVILEIAIDAVSGLEGDVFLVDSETGELVAHGFYPTDDRLIGYYHLPGQGITGHVAETGIVYVAEDLTHDSLVQFLPEESERLCDTQSSISLPLHAQERVVGVMNIGLREKRPFPPHEIRLLTAIAEIAGSALDRALLLETLEQRVNARTHDLAAANERLKELDKLKTKFVSDVSHELRTPMTNINLYLDLIESGNPDKQEQYLATLRGQTARLTNLIEDTLSLSRLEMGKSKIQFTPVSLNKIVEQVATAHLPRVNMAKLTLTTNLSSNLSLVRGERNQLAQVATNLLANAINYTAHGEIIIRTFADGSFACLEVKDSGQGIDPDDREHLFERFYRGHNAGQSNIPGTGLGLAIVKEIVDLHDGRIEIHNNETTGTTFQVFLPFS